MAVKAPGPKGILSFPRGFSEPEIFCRNFARNRVLSIMASNTGAESISLIPKHRSPTHEGVFSIFPQGSFPPYRAQTSNEGPSFETARNLSAIPAVPSPPINLKDLKPHLIHVDMNPCGAVPGRRPESSGADWSRIGRGGRIGITKGREAEFFILITPRGGIVRGRIFSRPRNLPSSDQEKAPLEAGLEKRGKSFFSAV